MRRNAESTPRLPARERWQQVGAACGGSSPDVESVGWLEALSDTGLEREEAMEHLHALLLRAARFEVARRHRIADGDLGELDKLAVQAGDDALVTIMRQLHTYKGDSRFTTWACKFAVVDAAAKSRRRSWQGRRIPVDADGWTRVLAEDRRASPDGHADTSELVGAARHAIAQVLSPSQRAVLVAIALNGVPIDVLAERLGTTRSALYETLHDARRRLRARLAEDGLALELPRHVQTTSAVVARTSPAGLASWSGTPRRN
jgi:RNA polymerase sigma-70 factor, ECF subfamily